MKNYESMSDFEINKQAALAMEFKDVKPHPNAKVCAGLESAIIADGSSIDYCNDPVDTWDVIDSIVAKGSLNFCDKGCVFFPKDVKLDVIHVDGKRLRAAVIVFLMMQEAEK